MDDVRTADHPSPDHELLEGASRVLIRSAAACASFCEHVEHNEPSTIHAVVDAAAAMRHLAGQLAGASGVSLHAAYLARIRSVEAASLMRYTSGAEETRLGGAEALSGAYRWEDVQVAQIIHDRQFHPDVFGLSKIDQLRHYTFHVTKLAGLLADAADTDSWAGFRDERLADIAIFGVKLATVCNERLPSDFVDEIAADDLAEPKDDTRLAQEAPL